MAAERLARLVVITVGAVAVACGSADQADEPDASVALPDGGVDAALIAADGSDTPIPLRAWEQPAWDQGHVNVGCAPERADKNLAPPHTLVSARTGLLNLGVSPFGPIWLEHNAGLQVYRGGKMDVLFNDADMDPAGNWASSAEWFTFESTNTFYYYYVTAGANSGTSVASCNGGPFVAVALDNDFLFGLWSDDSQMWLDGGSRLWEVLKVPLGAPFCNAPGEVVYDLQTEHGRGIAVDEQYLYALLEDADTGDFTLRRIPKAGGTPVILAAGVDPESPKLFGFNARATLVAHRGTVIWAHEGLYGPEGHVRYVQMAASDRPATTLVYEPDDIPTQIPGLFEQAAIALDDEYAYWTTQTGFVKRIRLCGGEPEILASNQDQPIAIAVDDNAVYWLNHGTKPGTGTVMRMRKLDAPGYSDAGITDADASAKDADGGD